MAIEAVSAASSGMTPNQGATNLSDVTPTYQTEARAPSEAADAFRDTLSKVHDELKKFSAEGSQNSKPADPVEAAKAEMLPSPWKSASATEASLAAQQAAGPQAAPTPNATSDGNQVLRKSFDHAIYVTLISQVVGGLSQTTSTLTRQQ